VDIAADCPNVGIPRPTGISIDPTNHRRVWVGLEVDGVRHSADGGDKQRLAAHLCESIEALTGESYRELERRRAAF